MTARSPLVVPDSDGLESLDGSTFVTQPSCNHGYTGHRKVQQVELVQDTRPRRQAASRAEAHISRYFLIASNIMQCTGPDKYHHSHFIPGGALDSQTTETQWVGTLGAQPREDFTSTFSPSDAKTSVAHSVNRLSK